MQLLDHSTDKILLVVILFAVLGAAIYTMDPTMLDAFKLSLGVVIGALSQRVTTTEQK